MLNKVHHFPAHSIANTATRSSVIEKIKLSALNLLYRKGKGGHILTYARSQSFSLQWRRGYWKWQHLVCLWAKISADLLMVHCNVSEKNY
jgi:hypothetical protein